MKAKRIAIVLVIALTMVAASFSTAFGCTSLFVGKDISANGSRYISRTEDMADNYGKIFGIKPAADHPEGEMYEDTYGFSMPYPAHTLKYSYIRDSEGYGETVIDENGNPVGEAYAAAGQNELGVSMTATVSTSMNRTARSADPLNGESGLCEVSIPSVVLAVATSARHACEYLGSIIDQYGAGEANSILISDANESWDFEMVSGTQWVAVKLDDTRAAMNPNIMLLDYVDVNDKENVICSEKLVSLPQEKGFLVADEQGRINVAATYGSTGYASYNTRIYQGLFFLNQALAEVMDNTTVNAENPNPFYVDPTWKLDLLDIIHFEGYRGKGSLEDQDGEHRTSRVRSIGTNGQTECHIFETRPGMPVELATIQWECNQDAEFGIFIPHFTALMTEVDESYAENATKYANVPKGTSLTWNIARVNDLCNKNRALNVGEKVREYFDAYQTSLIEQQKTVDTAMLALFNEDPAKAVAAANAISKDLTKQVLEMTTGLIDELEEYIAQEDHSEPFVPSAMTDEILPFYAVPGDNIDELRAEGLTALDKQLDEVDPFAYLPAQLDEITALYDAAKVNINAACSKDRIDAVLANFADAVAEVQTGEEIIADMQAATEAAQAAAEAAQATADEANAKAEAAAEELAKAQEDLAKAQADLAATQEALAKAQEAQEADAEAIEALEKALEDAQTEAAQAAQAAEAKALEAQQAAEAAQKAADEAQKAITDAQTAQAAAEQKIGELEEALAAAKEEAAADKEAAQAALDEAKAAQEADAAAIAALKDEITKLQTTIAKNSTVSGLKLTQKSRKVTVKFSKTAGANAYQIQYKLSTAKKWTNLKKSTTKAKATSKKLKKAKKYTFRVRTITKVDGKKVYGKWATKSIKIKK